MILTWKPKWMNCRFNKWRKFAIIATNMSESNMEKFICGQFSLTPEEREKAKKEGRLEEKEEKMRKATKSLRGKQAERAEKTLEKAARKALKDNLE